MRCSLLQAPSTIPHSFIIKETTDEAAKAMRKRSMCIVFVLLLVVAMVAFVSYAVFSQTALVDYDETVVFNQDYNPDATNISIYYDVCFHNVTFNVVDDPGFMVKINYKLTVLVDGAVGKNTKLQVTNSTYGRYVTIQILKENPSDICALHAGDARATVDVTINSAYTLDIEASSGDGNINLTASNATFQRIYFHHGVGCLGNNGINITNSTVYDDLTCEVSAGHFWVRLENVPVGGTLSCAPEGQGTLIVI